LNYSQFYRKFAFHIKAAYLFTSSLRFPFFIIVSSSLITQATILTFCFRFQYSHSQIHLLPL